MTIKAEQDDDTHTLIETTNVLHVMLSSWNVDFSCDAISATHASLQKVDRIR